jgi:transcription initiation factor TFIIB
VNEVSDSLGELDRLSEILSVPERVRDEAARICKEGMERGLSHRKPVAQVVGASLYAACREGEVPTTLDDVSRSCGVGRKELASCYRLLVNELDLKIPVAGPAEYVAKVASRAKVSAEVQSRALEILSRAEKAGVVSGSYPNGVAAAALYIAAGLGGEKLTQETAAEAAGVRPATLRKEYKRLRRIVKAQPGRTTRRKKPVLSEMEASRSTCVEVAAVSRA